MRSGKGGSCRGPPMRESTSKTLTTFNADGTSTTRTQTAVRETERPAPCDTRKARAAAARAAAAKAVREGLKMFPETPVDDFPTNPFAVQAPGSVVTSINVCPGAALANKPSGIGKPSKIATSTVMKLPTKTLRPPSEVQPRISPAMQQSRPSSAIQQLRRPSPRTSSAIQQPMPCSGMQQRGRPSMGQVKHLVTATAPLPPNASPLPSTSRAWFPPTPGPGFVPERGKVKKKTSKHRVVDQAGNVTETTTTIRSIVPERAVQPHVPHGQYILPMQHKPYQPQGKRQIFSSPRELRQQMEEGASPAIKKYMVVPPMGVSRDPRLIRKAPAMKDVYSGNLQVFQGSPSHDASFGERDFMDMHADPALASQYWGSPIPSPELRREVEQDLSMMASSSKAGAVGGVATAVRHGETSAPIVMSPRGPKRVMKQVSVDRVVDRSPDLELTSKQMRTIEADRSGRAQKIEMDVTNLDTEAAVGPVPSHEVVEVKSTVSILEDGQRQTSDVIVYESEKPKDSAGDVGEVARLIEEENQDIAEATAQEPPELINAMPTAYPLKKKVENLQLTSESVSILEQSLRHTPTRIQEEEQEEVQPEVLASIMHTEEQGIDLGTQPTKMYNYLFPEEKTEPVMDVSSAAPKHLQDVVVPTSVPSNLHASAITSDIAQVVIATQSGAGEKPPDNIYSEVVMKKEPPKVQNVAVSRKIKTKKSERKAIDKEEPPWELDEIMPIAEVVGAEPPNFLSVSLPEEEIVVDEASQRIEYFLTMDAPRYSSRVQLRGSQKPSWFPGYLAAFPDLPEIIRVEKSPSIVLTKAYRAVQPDYFPEESFIL